jgi:hypothetical protein
VHKNIICTIYFLRENSISWKWSNSFKHIIEVLSPADAQDNCFKRSIKIYIKTAPTGFGAITIIRERII